MAKQLPFDLPHRPALEAEDFLVTEANAAAVRLVDLWPDWPARAHVLVGPARCGKTHLVHVWRNRSQAPVVSCAHVTRDMVATLAKPPGLAIEDVDRGIGDETALFHLLNLAQERGFFLLLTARTPAGEWAVGLPDLRSRLRSLPMVTIGAPDDALLKGLLVKLFADRQLDVDPSVIDYLFTRMTRTMAGVFELVRRLDRESLATGRRITRQLAAKILRESDEGQSE